jgi:hypothetical protein
MNSFTPWLQYTCISLRTVGFRNPKAAKLTCPFPFVNLSSYMEYTDSMYQHVSIQWNNNCAWRILSEF